MREGGLWVNDDHRRAERQSKHDRGERLPLTDEVFELGFDKEHKVLLRELALAKDDICRLQLQCEAQDLDVNGNRMRHHDQSALPESRAPSIAAARPSSRTQHWIDATVEFASGTSYANTPAEAASNHSPYASHGLPSHGCDMPPFLLSGGQASGLLAVQDAPHTLQQVSLHQVAQQPGSHHRNRGTTPYEADGAGNGGHYDGYSQPPALSGYGIETLHPDFRQRKHPRRFFQVGKVFMVLWCEPAGDTGSNSNIATDQTEMTPGRYGERVFSKVRRFVVVRESNQYCTAVPILSYGRQGVAKRGIVKSEHGIIYTSTTSCQPEPELSELPGRNEAGMQATPIRVNPSSPYESLPAMSRINYGKIYTIEHNIKVKSIGVVHGDALAALSYQFQKVWTAGRSVVPLSARPPEPVDLDASSRRRAPEDRRQS